MQRRCRGSTRIAKLEQAQRDLDYYLSVWGEIYCDPRHADHHVIVEEVQALARAAVGPEADEPI